MIPRIELLRSAYRLAEDNPDLVVAASAMLATLRHCLEHCEKEGGPDLEFIIDDKSGHMLDVEMIRQSIAKAEGRS